MRIKLVLVVTLLAFLLPVGCRDRHRRALAAEAPPTKTAPAPVEEKLTRDQLVERRGQNKLMITTIMDKANTDAAQFRKNLVEIEAAIAELDKK
jgi:hypothetical protein